MVLHDYVLMIYPEHSCHLSHQQVAMKIKKNHAFFACSWTWASSFFFFFWVILWVLSFAPLCHDNFYLGVVVQHPIKRCHYWWHVGWKKCQKKNNSEKKNKGHGTILLKFNSTANHTSVWVKVRVVKDHWVLYLSITVELSSHVCTCGILQSLSCFHLLFLTEHACIKWI